MFGLFKKKKDKPNVSTEYLGTTIMKSYSILTGICKRVTVAVYRDYDIDSGKSLNVYVKSDNKIAYRFNPDVWDAEQRLIDL